MLLGLIAFVFGTTSAHAENRDVIVGVDDQPSYIGALLGLNVPTVTGTSVSTAMGLTLGTRISPSFGVGIFGSYNGQTSSGPYLGLPASTAMSVIVGAAQANYILGGLHLGGELGVSVRSWSGVSSTLSGGTSTATFLLGLNGGYDYKMSRNFSVGAEVHYFIPTSSTEGNFLQVLAAVKIWL